MVFGIRTPVQGRGPVASASDSRESPSPTRPGNEGPSGAREAPKGLSLTFGKKDAARGTLAVMAGTPPSAGTSGAVARATTPSPAGPPGQALDAARTFIRRPERKRRSVENMEQYQKQTDTYAALSNDRLLQEVMKTFEDIPQRVKDYPQMRRDIKTFLETQSDKSLRILFELSKRMKGLEIAPKIVPSTRTNTTPKSPESPEKLLERLEKVETNINTRLNDLEQKMSEGFQVMTERYDDCGSDILERVVDGIAGISDKVDAVKADMAHTTEGVRIVGHAAAALEEKIGGVVGEVTAGTEIIREAIREVTCAQKTDPLTYADVTAAKPGRRPALHSIAVTSEGSLETADEVLAGVKEAVDARGTGLKINKVRKAKNQTVILGCDSEAELKKVKERIESRGKGLIVAPIKNKNPLVVLKDVFLDSEDDEMVKALYSQNENIFRDLAQEDREMTIKYKKRTRNPRTSHVVVQVRPKVWQRMTEAGALYLDLQRVRVEDQSPLIQCTKCLAFGHGRKFCTESADSCSHCGGPHLREKCLEFIAGNEPQCRNCSHSKLQRTDHNAFSVECPVRKKWDYLARTTTAYA